MTRVALAVLVGSLLAATAAYGSAFLPGDAPGWAGPALAAASVMAMASVALLAVGRRGWGPLVGGLVLGGPLVAGALAAVWIVPALDPGDPVLVLGLPLRAAHLLYAIGLLPALVVPLLYASTFDRETLGDDALRRFRGEAARLRERPSQPADDARDGAVDLPADGPPQRTGSRGGRP